MSAEVLRRAASLMRKEASAPNMIAVIKRRTVCGATVHHGPDGPHHRDPAHPKWCNAQPAGATRPAPSDFVRTKAVALAVAKAMDDVAHAWEIADESADGYVYDGDDNYYPFEETVDGGWLTVALAYLGESA